MHSFLIIGATSEDQNQKVLSILSSTFSLQVPPSTLTYPPSNPDIYISQTHGIEESRNITHFLALTPYQQTHKIVIIPQADLLTLEAQNALLKTLEEPPPHSLIFLLTHSPYSLLPTVTSRLQIHELKTNLPKAPQALTSLSQILNLPPGNAIKLSEDLTPDRLAAITICQDFISILEPFLAQKTSQIDKPTFSPKQASGMIRSLTQTLKYLKSNTTLRLTIDNLIIQLRSASKNG